MTFTEKMHLEVGSLQYDENSIIGETLENKNNDRRISGFAINPGVYHDIIEIPASEISNITNTLQDRILLKDHNNSVDSAVGRVVYTENRINPDTGSTSTYYEAFIDEGETDLINKIDKNIVSSCSIGFKYTPVCSICGKELNECEHFIWDDDFHVIATDINAHELSIVGVPADAQATVTSNFANETFSEELLKLKTLKNKEGENKMVDFESKYDALKEELSKTNEAHEAKIAELKEEFDAKIADKTEECLSARQATEELQEKYDALSEEYKVLKEEADKIQEAKLSELRSEVLSLNEDVHAGLTEEEIAEFSEATLNRYKDMFSNIKANTPDVKVDLSGDAPYADELSEDATSLEKLLHRVQ